MVHTLLNVGTGLIPFLMLGGCAHVTSLAASVLFAVRVTVSSFIWSISGRQGPSAQMCTGVTGRAVGEVCDGCEGG